MGTNKRYAAHFDKLGDDRILQRLAADHPLQTLTDGELDLENELVTIDPRPKKARAWVRFGPHATLVDCEVMRWTSRAVGIRFMIGEQETRSWVWNGAVTSVRSRG